MKQFIEFKRQRELGEILSDTFGFLRNEFKPFFSTFFKIVGPYLVIMLICYAFYMYQFGNLLNFNVESSSSAVNSFILLLVGGAFFISIVAAYVLSQATTLFYIESYTKNRGHIHFNEIKHNVYQAFWPFMGLGILVGICVGLGLMFCLIPGIYLAVPLILSFAILVFDKKGVSEAFSYSFSLVKNHWWMTFASLFVIWIIVTVAGYTFALPSTIYTYAKMGILSGEMDAENFNMVDPVSTVLGIVSTLAQFILNTISVVAGALIYFDLNEKKNFTGTYERINTLGETKD
ncbi:hypothetical protein [Pareuzebyella sediminis]|uniref:hypothetical protein n=1 Tax=Pareuzebyella sediminis TaxID=2607998 RepID=UPI0011EE9894|nr:hypothetical protein [Pareuzebyella sediminis]